MRSRVVSSAVVPAIALPALVLGPGNHQPVTPAFGISRAVHIVTSTVGSIAPAASPAAPHHRAARIIHVMRHRQAPVVRYVVITCSGSGAVQPRTFQLACADGNDYLSNLNWSSWGPRFATAAGVQTMNDCTPTCAQGKFQAYPVRVILWNNAGVPRHPGQRRYTMITILYTGRQPSVPDGTTRIAGPPSVTGGLWS